MERTNRRQDERWEELLSEHLMTSRLCVDSDREMERGQNHQRDGVETVGNDRTISSFLWLPTLWSDEEK